MQDGDYRDVIAECDGDRRIDLDVELRTMSDD